MHQPIHAIAGRREMTPERIAGLGFVGLLHVVAVSAIVFGLQQHFAPQAPPGPIVVETPHDKIEPKTPPALPKIDLNKQVVVQRPVIDIAPDQPRNIIDTTTKHEEPPPQTKEVVASIPDTATTGIMSTHSSPAYPLLDRRLGHEGTVTLRMIVAADGTVSDATVVKSSGYSGLDAAAVAWVIAHWRYRAATHAGGAVASEATAAVVFSLKNSG